MSLQSLRARSVLMVTVLYAVAGLLTLGAFFLVARGIVASFGRRFAQERAVLARNRVMAPIQREVALALKLADDPVLKAWMREETNPGLRTQALEQLESYRRAFTDQSYFFINDASRNYYFDNSRREFQGRELRYRLMPEDPTMAWYFHAMQHVKDFEVHVDSSEQLGILKVWINAVVRKEGHNIGMGGTGFELTQFLKDVVQGQDAGAQTILVDGKGTIQAHPDDGLMRYNAQMKDESRRITLHQLLDKPEEREVLSARLTQLMQAPTRVDTFHLTIKGREQLVAATALPQLDWVALVLVDPSQVVGLRTFAPIALVLLLSLLATILLVIALLDRVVLRPLRTLTGAAAQIASGNYALALPSGRQDEIGTLTRSFSHMSAMVGDTTAHLEQKVQERTLALSEANQRLQASNRKIMESLEVAQLLQTSLLPSAELMASQVPDHFVIYRQRELVGGDFYGLFTDTEGFLIAVADCTGHGVPGALMTMSARSVLEQLLVKHGPRDPALLLREMNRAMKATLHVEADTRGLDNGLEMGLLWISRRERSLRFASARISLMISRVDGNWEEWPGDKQSLGYRRSDPDFHFDCFERPFEVGEAYYLMTDGLLDQAGGAKGFGLGRTRLRELLEPQRTQPMPVQGEAIQEALEHYQAGRPQRDDIIFIGFRI